MAFKLPKKDRNNPYNQSKLLKEDSTKPKRKSTKSKKTSSILLVMKQYKLKRSLMPLVLKSKNSKINSKPTYLTLMMNQWLLNKSWMFIKKSINITFNFKLMKKKLNRTQSSKICSNWKEETINLWSNAFQIWRT